MKLEGSDSARRNARRLRSTMTPPEIALWLSLRRNEAGLRFRKQYAAGRYVLDFYCAPARLAIEVDGEAHERGDRTTRDGARDAWLTTRDVQTLRYSAREVLANLEGVVAQVLRIATDRLNNSKGSRRPPPPTPSAPPPPGGGG